MRDIGSNNNMARQHAPLVERVIAITSSLYAQEMIDLRDAGDPRPCAPRSRTVRLTRSDVPAITRQSSGAALVAYKHPASEAALAQVLAAMARRDDPIAADPLSLSVFALADRLAQSDIPVLVNGPTGTGKEVLSRFIHARSARANGPFIAVNCAAMPETMLEAMLFGHQKGAFTGATQASEGFFRAADGGTLLLDEIAEMPLVLQAKLLRALQEQEVVPIGATRAVKVDVRIIACANRDLPTEVDQGRFRADLFYRLNVFPLTLPALRERTDDIAPLAAALALRHAPPGLPCPMFSDGALAMLKLHSWPGNVRELENVVRRALLLGAGKPELGTGHIAFDAPARMVTAHSRAANTHTELADLAADDPRTLSTIVRNSQARAIISALDACDGSRIAAARELGISERTLRYRLASFRDAGIAIGRSAAGGR